MQKGNMKFFRDPHSSDFTVINARILRDERLSAKAKGIMAYLLGLPDDWQLYKAELAKHFRDGKDSLNSAMKELQDNGYLDVKETKTACVCELDFTVYENPVRENSSGKPDDHAEIPHDPCGNSDGHRAENPQILNTEHNIYIPTTYGKSSSSLNEQSVRRYAEEDLSLKLGKSFYHDFISFCSGQGMTGTEMLDYLKWITESKRDSVRNMNGFVFSTACEISLLNEYREYVRNVQEEENKNKPVFCSNCGKEQSGIERIQGYCTACGTQYFSYDGIVRKAADGK